MTVRDRLLELVNLLEAGSGSLGEGVWETSQRKNIKAVLNELKIQEELTLELIQLKEEWKSKAESLESRLLHFNKEMERLQLASRSGTDEIGELL